MNFHQIPNLERIYHRKLERNLQNEKISHVHKELVTYKIQNSFRKNQKNHSLLSNPALLPERNCVNFRKCVHETKKLLEKNVNASESILNVPDILNGAFGWLRLPGIRVANWISEEERISGCDGI